MAEQVKKDIQKIVKQISEREHIPPYTAEYFSECDVVIDPHISKLATGEIAVKRSGEILDNKIKKMAMTLTYDDKLPLKLRLKVNPKYFRLSEELRNSLWAHEINEAIAVYHSSSSSLLRFVQNIRKYFLIGKLADYIIHKYVDKRNRALGYWDTNKIIKECKLI